MDVNDPCELRSILVASGNQGSDRGWTWMPRLCLRCGQKGCDRPQDIRIALRGIVESRCIDEHHPSSVEGEFISELNLSRA
jgi:hypothetical protein